MRRAPLSPLLAGALLASLSGTHRLEEAPRVNPKDASAPPFLRRTSVLYGLSSQGGALTKAERRAQAQAGEKRRSLKERKSRRAKRKQRGGR